MARIATLITPELVFLLVALVTFVVAAIAGAGPQGVPGTIAVLVTADQAQRLLRVLPKGRFRTAAASVLPSA